MAAILSDCGKYRYLLSRKLSDQPESFKPILFIMLNPSTADAVIDDPTIRRCVAFAKREGCSYMSVVNLFALRATDPKELEHAKDSVGPDNDMWLSRQIELHRSGLIIAAWGSSKFAGARAAEVQSKFGPFRCLGKTKSGAPRHPLYLRTDAALQNL